MIERKFMPFMPEFTGFILYGIFILALLIFFYGIHRQLAKYGVSYGSFFRTLGSRIKADPQKFLSEFVKYIGFQRKTQTTFLGTIVHSPIFYSFLALLLGTTLVFVDVDILGKISDLKILQGDFYLVFEVVLDTAGLLFLVGIGVAFFRRLILRPSYIHSKGSDYVALTFLLVIVVSGFFLEGLRIHQAQISHAGFSYIGHFIAQNFFADAPPDRTLSAYRFLWFFHMTAVFGFIAYIPFSKFKHFLLIPVNLLLYPPKTYAEKAKLSTPINILEIEEDDEAAEEDTDQIGVGSLEDLDWRQKLQLDSCTNCGRCEDVCPANKAGRLLSPRNVIQKLGNEIAVFPNSRPFFEEVIHQEEMWGCTNCYACMEACPSFIRQVDYFLDFRRFIVGQAFDDEAKITLLGNIERNGNPYGLPSYDRTEWLSEYDVSNAAEKDSFEYLYFIGCSSCYDQRSKEITQSVITVLNTAGIDFVIMGEEEKCCGEPAKRIGEEGLFQMTAIENIELFNAYEVRKILVHCPHCYNTLKHEYKDFGADYEIIHHSQLLFELIQDGRLELRKSDRYKSITFHDPCNLGRLNGIFEQPRKILAKLGEIREMDHFKAKSLCCGGGGGNAFYQIEKEEKRISQIRLEEAVASGSDRIGLACPFCMIMFEDAKGNFPEEVNVPEFFDLAEMVSQSIQDREKAPE
jgi:Fe-S oxidoreductase/nitrate reductase gamma subunit